MTPYTYGWNCAVQWTGVSVAVSNSLSSDSVVRVMCLQLLPALLDTCCVCLCHVHVVNYIPVCQFNES